MCRIAATSIHHRMKQEQESGKTYETGSRMDKGQQKTRASKPFYRSELQVDQLLNTLCTNNILGKTWVGVGQHNATGRWEYISQHSINGYRNVQIKSTQSVQPQLLRLCNRWREEHEEELTTYLRDTSNPLPVEAPALVTHLCHVISTTCKKNSKDATAKTEL